MHYYQFNIGDYTSHTGHLTTMQDLAYRRLLDWYYLNEKPIPLDPIRAAVLILMKNNFPDVEGVLIEFFTKTNNGWINKRADREIATYQGFSVAGKRGAAKRWGTGGDSPPITPPIANNKHKTVNTKQETIKYIPPINGELLTDWLRVRKKKRAGDVTERVFNGLQREAGIAGLTDEQAVTICCERTWQTFTAEWYLKKPNPAWQSVQDARLDTARQIFGGLNGTQRKIIDITPRQAIESGGEGFPETIPRIRESDVG